MRRRRISKTVKVKIIMIRKVRVKGEWKQRMKEERESKERR